MQELGRFDEVVNNQFDALNIKFTQKYQQLTKLTTNVSLQFIPMIVKIGKLQLLRKLVVRQINFASKVECSQYTACLETLNSSILHNIVEIKETAQVVFLERDYPEVAAQIH